MPTQRSRSTASVPRSHRSVVRAIARYEGCLPQVARHQRRVLALRGGIGPGPALTRAQVARRLGLGVADETRIERRGLRRLQTLDRSGACAAGSSSATADGVASTAGSPSSGSADGSGTGAGDPAAGAVKGVSASGGSDEVGDGGGSPVALPIEDPEIVVGLLLLAAALGVLVLAVRRELRQR